jgi:hypothetical protein
MARHLIPAIIGLFLTIKLKVLWLFLGIGGPGQLISMGYGIPDDPTKVPDNPDKGSLLGRLVLKLCKNNYEKAAYITRGIWGALVAFMLGITPAIITSHWLFFICYLILNFAVGAILSYFKVKDVIIERSIGAGLGTICLI